MAKLFLQSLTLHKLTLLNIVCHSRIQSNVEMWILAIHQLGHAPIGFVEVRHS